MIFLLNYYQMEKENSSRKEGRNIMNFQKSAAEIIEKIGGKENIETMTHCVTRLRIVVADESKVDLEGVKGVEGVINCVISSGQYQVVIGPTVKEMYKAAFEIIGTASAEIPAPEKKEKLTIKGLAKQGLDTLISCFVPAIPAIAGSGMIKVLVVLLNYVGLLEMGSSTYTILNTIGDGIFYFLPFFVAFNAAKKMNVDVFLSMVLAAIILHPNLTALGEAGTSTTFLCFSMPIINYSAQALPVIFGVWLLKYVDKFADKISPSIVKVFLRPMISLLVTATIVLVAIGPVSIVLSNILFAACAAMQSWGWLAVGINAFLFPLMVLTGTHNATIPLIIQLFAVQGFDTIFLPSGMAANIAQAGAACAVALKTKNKTLRSTGLSATLSALLGITEPALYGVNLRMKRPFIGVLAGSLLGGCFIGLVGLSAPTFVTPSLLTIPIFAGGAPNFLLGLSAVPVTFLITFVITYFLGFEDLPANK